MGKNVLNVGNISAECGTRVDGHLSGIEISGGNEIRIPIVLINGVHEGPTVYLGAGIHGDEICTIEVVHEVIRRTNPKRLSGQLICIPMQSPMALQFQHRLPLQFIVKSPLDLSPADLWILFPGDENGNTPERLVAVLDSAIMKADYAIDMHTPTTGGRYTPFIFLPPERIGAARDEALKLAQAFGPDYILSAESGTYVVDGALHVEASRRGIPSFGVELGEGGRIEGSLVDRGAEGIANVLRHLNMLDEPLTALGTAEVVTSMTAVRTNHAGLLEQLASLGDYVQQGDVLANVTNEFGVLVEEIKAPHAGPLMRTTTFATVSEGERIAQVGVKKS